MFPIYKIDTDKTIESKGTKEKYWVSLNGQKALIKINRYENNNDVRSYNVSEKIFSEIAKILKFSCVDTDFIVDENKHYGIASFDYKTNNDNIILSGDDLFFSALNRFPTKNAKNNIVPEDYTYENIVKILSHYDNSYELQKKFNKIMIMDELGIDKADNDFTILSKTEGKLSSDNFLFVTEKRLSELKKSVVE